jgi:hypothetical protein
MRKLQEDLRAMDQKKEEMTATLESQLLSIKQTRAKTDQGKEFFSRLSAEWEAEKAIKMKEINDINAAADKLLKLARDDAAIAAMEQLPEFLSFEDIKIVEPELFEPIPEPQVPKDGKRKRPVRRKVKK